MPRNTTIQNTNYKLKKVNSDNFVKQASEHNDNEKRSYKILNTKRFLLIAGIFFAIIVVLIVISAFYDWDISRAIALPFLKDDQYITGSNYALLYEIIGCIAPFVILPIFAWTAFRYVMHFRGLKSWRKVFQIAILVLIGFIGFFSVFFYLTYNFFPILINVITNGGWNEEAFNIYYGPLWYVMCFIFVFVSIGFNTALFFAFGKLKTQTELVLFKFAMFVFICFVFCQLITGIVKYTGLFARERFRAIWLDDSLYPGGYDYSTINGKEILFKPWWHLGWDSSVVHTIISTDPFADNVIRGNAFSSFPSGHVSFGAFIFVLPFLVYAIKGLNKNWKIALINVGCFIAIVLLMEARVQSAAHYLSDTVFAALIDFGVIAAVGAIFYGGKRIKRSFETYNANCKTVQFVLLPLLTIIPTIAMIVAVKWFV